jgi:hypothetical protein
MLTNLKGTALTFFVVVSAFYSYDISIVKSLLAGLLISICIRNQKIRRLYENICVFAIIIKLANPNIENQFISFVSKHY